MAYRTLLYAVAADVATIMLNRPDNLNGMTSQMRAELLHAIKAAGRDARAIILTGAGRGFCSGQDLGQAKTADDIDLAAVLREEYAPILRAIRNCPVPIICAVNGPAAGAGANIALACDIVVAARSAYFLQAFSRIGLMPDAGGTWILPRLAGVPRAMGMALLAEPVDATQAAEWGLIWEMVEDDQLGPHTKAMAQRLAAGPTQAYAAIRKTLRDGLTADYDDHLETEAERQGNLGRSRDFAEGVLAFLEKRRPQFEGR